MLAISIPRDEELGKGKRLIRRASTEGAEDTVVVTDHINIYIWIYIYIFLTKICKKSNKQLIDRPSL